MFSQLHHVRWSKWSKSQFGWVLPIETPFFDVCQCLPICKYIMDGPPIRPGRVWNTFRRLFWNRATAHLLVGHGRGEAKLKRAQEKSADKPKSSSVIDICPDQTAIIYGTTSGARRVADTNKWRWTTTLTREISVMDGPPIRPGRVWNTFRPGARTNRLIGG